MPQLASGLLFAAALAACSGSIEESPGQGGGEITERLQLDSDRAVVGEPIAGNIVVTNPGSSINLSSGCRPGYTVILSNSHYQPIAAWPDDCAFGPFVIPPGVTRLPVSVSTTYNACSPSGEATSTTPSCRVGDQMPPLPPGVYQAQVVWEGKVPIAPAPPVSVSLVPGS